MKQGKRKLLLQEISRSGRKLIGQAELSGGGVLFFVGRDTIYIMFLLKKKWFIFKNEVNGFLKIEIN